MTFTSIDLVVKEKEAFKRASGWSVMYSKWLKLKLEWISFGVRIPFQLQLEFEFSGPKLFP